MQGKVIGAAGALERLKSLAHLPAGA